MAQHLWFRLYTEIVQDRKLRRHDPAVRWVWIALLCAIKQSPVRGEFYISENVPGTFEDLADMAAVPMEVVGQAVAIFKDQDMLAKEDGPLKALHWDERQYESDSSTKRTRRFRERRRGRCDDSETSQERSRAVTGNASGTAPDPEADPEIKEDHVSRTPAGSRPEGIDTSAEPKPASEVTLGFLAASLMDFYNEQFRGTWKRPLQLTPDRKAKMLARLKRFTFEDLKQAIVNIRASPFHCGQNDSGHVYATPEFLFRNDSQVDKWLNMEVTADGRHSPPRDGPDEGERYRKLVL